MLPHLRSVCVLSLPLPKATPTGSSSSQPADSPAAPAQAGGLGPEHLVPSGTLQLIVLGVGPYTPLQGSLRAPSQYLLWVALQIPPGTLREA